MKINESTLVTYATSSSCPTDKEGWLWKRGEVNKNFQKRYFVLKGNLLFYFEKRYDKEPIGVIIIEGCTIELAEEEQEMCAFKIVFHGEGRRTYYLGTESQVSFENVPQKVLFNWICIELSGNCWRLDEVLGLRFLRLHEVDGNGITTKAGRNWGNGENASSTTEK